MNVIKKNIPNFITLLNLLCGSISIVFALNNHIEIASILIFLGVFLDFFDGFFARLFKSENDFGLQLDSMADLITSGLAPSLILFTLFSNLSIEQTTISSTLTFPLVALTAFLLPVFAAIRLSNFNLDKNQKDSFIGLPTPMVAIFIASLPFNNLIDLNLMFLCIITILLSLLMVSKINLFSLKIKELKFQKNQINIIRISMITISLILLFAYSLSAIPFIVVLYILLSITNNLI